ncbi:MAG: hypothetical protein FWC11_01190 [Firmicutes bacterium]|nr:hypothetical protein [Bacillota bacterium]
MNQLLLFAISIALGIVLRALYVGQTKLAKIGKHRALKIALDVLWCFLSFGGFFFLSFFVAGGEFHFFMLAGVFAGFFGLMLVPFRRTKKVNSE